MLSSSSLTICAFLGGGVGAALRYTVTRLLPGHLCGGWPCATLAVNIIGCLLMGLLSAYMAVHTAHRPMLQALLQAGFLGGLTTFSAFSSDIIRLMHMPDQGVFKAAFYTGISVTGGVAAYIVGYRIAD